MNKFFILTALIFSFGICKADFDSKTLPELIENSQLIIECKIQDISFDEIRVKIIEVLKGDSSLNVISVSKFKDWTCASRWSAYEIGQTEIIFLKRSLKNNRWFTVGAGNEGEMPIENGFLFYKTVYMKIDNSPEKLKLKAGAIYGYKFNLIASKKAITEYLKNLKEIYILISDNRIDNYKTDNLFLKRIIGELNEIKN